LQENIALAMIAASYAEIGTVVEVSMPHGPVPATIVERPFFDPKKKLAAVEPYQIDQSLAEGPGMQSADTGDTQTLN